MTRSDSIASLAGALAKAQQEMEGAAKAAINPHFRSKYADLASVWDACRGPLTKHGLSILQPVKADGSAVTVTTILLHSSGEFLAEDLTLTATQSTPQAVGSAITYGRRYGLAAMVGIAPEDDDGNAASTQPTTQASGKANGGTPPAPDGFKKWQLEMEIAAGKGLAALEQVWKAGSKHFRDYAESYLRDWKETLKHSALDVDALKQEATRAAS